jgi:predicted Zn-dependent peptidase
VLAADPPQKTFPTESPNLVSVYIVAQTGSRNEVEPGKTGFAHLFEHMMFRGTDAYRPEKYVEVLQRAGAVLIVSKSSRSARTLRT